MKSRTKKIWTVAFCLFMVVLGIGSLSDPRLSDAEIRSKVVMLRGNWGECSGEQVRASSGTNYILSAGHCRVLADKDGSIEVITEGKHSLMRKVVAEDKFSDLLLIEGLPNVEGFDLASKQTPQEQVITYTHGAGYDTYTTRGELIQLTEVMAPLMEVTSPEELAYCLSMPKLKEVAGWMGDVCVIDVTEMATTAMIVPGSSGGAVLDGDIRLVGVVSAGGGGFGYLVPLSDMVRFLSSY